MSTGILREEVIVPNQLSKRVLREGDASSLTPPPNADVTVHYTGKLLDGTVFDSSVKRNEPFKFKIGQGSVIKGWDQGVATMKLGEKCILRCEPDFAYGASGSPPTIPPNSTLEFEVELLSWSDMEAVADTEDNVEKRLKRAGSGYSSPTDSSTATIKYSARLLPAGTTFFEQKEEKLVIGEDPAALQGLEAAIKSMKQGEISVFKVKSAWAYGSAGNSALKVPANSDLEYEIELLAFDKPKDKYDMNFQEKVEYMTKLKDLGNKFFKAGQIDRANSKYSEVVKVFQHEKDFSADQLKAVNSVRVPSLQNQAICKFKLKNYSECIEKCNEALKLDENNIKCLFKRGQAQFALDALEEAERDFIAALKLDAENKEIQRELALLRKKTKAQQDLERKKFGGFFNRISLVSDAEIEAAKKSQSSAEAKEDFSSEEESDGEANPSVPPTEEVANPSAKEKQTTEAAPMNEEA
jgi:FK506-binding protein 4/5